MVLTGPTEAEPSDETTPKPSSNKTSPPAPTSQPPSPPPAEKPPVKRGPGKKPGKKLGNNQYTKKNFDQGESSPYGRKRQGNGQPAGSGDDAPESVTNGAANGNGTAASKTSPGAEHTNGNGTGKGKFGRGRKAMANSNGYRALAPGEEVERTFTNMHAALQNMSAYVTKQQDDLTATGIGGGKSPLDSEAGALMTGGAVLPTSATSEASTGERKFENLSTADMAAQLQKNIADWQRQWGHLAAA